MNSKAEGTLPVMDDTPAAEPTEQALLDAVLRGSEFLKDSHDEVPLPNEEDLVEVPEESDEEYDESDEAVIGEETENDDGEGEDEDADDESATQKDSVFTSDDLDLDAQVMVKVDGEERTVSFGDLLKGFQTDAHLSKQGRELGEARKSFDTERTARLQELEQAAALSNAVLIGAEQSKAKAYHEMEAKIKKARADGETYEINDLKDKREQIQSEYWEARRNREGLQAQFDNQRKTQSDEQLQHQLSEFTEIIPTLIPDFSEDVATSIREFALEEGIADELLSSVTDPMVVKFIDDYRRLKQGVNKGKAKRKAKTAKKAIPIKKAKAPATKAKTEADKRRARAFSPDSSESDQMAFLRDFAAKSLNQ